MRGDGQALHLIGVNALTLLEGSIVCSVRLGGQQLDVGGLEHGRIIVQRAPRRVEAVWIDGHGRVADEFAQDIEDDRHLRERETSRGWI